VVGRAIHAGGGRDVGHLAVIPTSRGRLARCPSSLRVPVHLRPPGRGVPVPRPLRLPPADVAGPDRVPRTVRRAAHRRRRGGGARRSLRGPGPAVRRRVLPARVPDRARRRRARRHLADDRDQGQVERVAARWRSPDDLHRVGRAADPAHRARSDRHRDLGRVRRRDPAERAAGQARRQARRGAGAPAHALERAGAEAVGVPDVDVRQAAGADAELHHLDDAVPELGPRAAARHADHRRRHRRLLPAGGRRRPAVRAHRDHAVPPVPGPAPGARRPHLRRGAGRRVPRSPAGAARPRARDRRRPRLRRQGGVRGADRGGPRGQLHDPGDLAAAGRGAARPHRRPAGDRAARRRARRRASGRPLRSDPVQRDGRRSAGGAAAPRRRRVDRRRRRGRPGAPGRARPPRRAGARPRHQPRRRARSVLPAHRRASS
jgi:hypothetical protein